MLKLKEVSMKRLACTKCSTQHSMGEMYGAMGMSLCSTCAEAWVDEQRQNGVTISKGTIARLVDPTICAICSSDNGEVAFDTPNGVPFCAECTERCFRYPYPAWIKASMVIVLALVITSFVHNWRFVQGY